MAIRASGLALKVFPSQIADNRETGTLHDPSAIDADGVNRRVVMAGLTVGHDFSLSLIRAIDPEVEPDYVTGGIARLNVIPARVTSRHVGADTSADAGWHGPDYADCILVIGPFHHVAVIESELTPNAFTVPNFDGVGCDCVLHGIAPFLYCDLLECVITTKS